MKKTALLIIALMLTLTCLCSCDITDIADSKLKIKYKNDGGNAIVTALPDNVTLPEIVIPDEYEGRKVTAIADFAAVNLENVTKITIGKYVSEIGLWAMENNKKLTAIEVDDENEFFCDIDGVLYSKDMKTLIFYPMARDVEELTASDGTKITGISYEIPDGVEVIRTKAFYRCSAIRELTLPSTLKTIEEKAFFRCSFSEITIPDGLEVIGKDAFAYCTELQEITIPDSVTQIGEYAFYNCIKLLNITVNSSEEELTLGKKWYPTNNGLEINELSISWENSEV